jgi:deazaflavin-dependent oxidoreductase (nitroreductase family)
VTNVIRRLSMATSYESPNATLAQSSRRVFPTADTALYQVIGDPTYRESFHRRLKWVNRYVVAFYRIGLLPLLGAGKTTMLLTTRGRKSKQLRSFPVGYFRIGGEIHLLSGWGRDANWYKNLLANPEEVWLQVGFRRFPVRAEILEDPAEIRRTIERLVSESPSDAQRLFGWDPQHDHLDAADFSPIVERVLIVKFSER